MCSDYARSALMYVDYSGDVYAGMGIKAMKSFGRPRGRNLKDKISYYLHTRGMEHGRCGDFMGIFFASPLSGSFIV
jgi:hypothetical protein